MNKLVPVLYAVFAVLLISCNKEESVPSASDLPRATVMMRDGTKVSGTVQKSTPSDMTLLLEGGVTRSISIKDVRSVNYDDSASPDGQSKTVSSESHDNHYHPNRASIQTKTFQAPAGTEISVRTEESIDSAAAVEGQTYAGEVTSDVLDGAKDVVIPRGSNAQIVIKSASKGGRFRGASDLVLDLQSVSIGGQQYALSTTDLEETGRNGLGANKRTAEFVGGGAAIGAVIGAIAGQGKGAAIGASSGAGAGALGEILTKGGSIKIPAESVLTFKLDKPLRVVQRK